MSNFLTLSYWFSSIPVPFLTWAFWLLIVKFSVFVLIGVVLHLIARMKRDDLYWREGVARLAAILFQTGLIGLALVWFTQQQVGFFGARAWFLLLAAVFVVRVAFV